MDFNRCFGKKTTNIIMKCNMNKNSVPVLICYFSADSPYILALIHIYSINTGIIKIKFAENKTDVMYNILVLVLKS